MQNFLKIRKGFVDAAITDIIFHEMVLFVLYATKRKTVLIFRKTNHRPEGINVWQARAKTHTDVVLPGRKWIHWVR
jgi:hypothetical protein